MATDEEVTLCAPVSALGPILHMLCIKEVIKGVCREVPKCAHNTEFSGTADPKDISKIMTSCKTPRRRKA